MAVPDYQHFMLSILRLLADGATLSVSEIRARLAQETGMTADDLADEYPNGTNRYAGRVGWALQYLKQAGVIESPSRAHYRITERGRELLALGPERVDNRVLSRYEEFNEFKRRSRERSPDAGESIDAEETGTPQERLDDAHQELQDHVAADLLQRLRTMAPLRLEQVVLDVLNAMGYGGKDPERTSLTRPSYDRGLDGVIKEDELGLDQLVVQVKRYNSPVEVKHIREFAGSLDEHGTNKGVFFTTDKFTRPALEYAAVIPKRIILIDGPEMARLMVKHGVGVSVTKTLQITRVDSDYFDAEAQA